MKSLPERAAGRPSDVKPSSKESSRRAGQQRLAVALAVGLLCGVASWLIIKPARRDSYQDFAFLWFAAKAILAGKSPYRTVLSTAGDPRFFYPLTTPLAILPFVVLSVRVAGPVFVGLSCGALAYVVTADAWWPLWIFGSGSMFVAIVAASFAIVLPLGLFVPWLGWLGVFKPNIGLAILAYRPARKTLFVMMAIGLISVAVQPSWPEEWLNVALKSPFHFAPWRVPGGFVVLLAVLRWRLPEARLLAIMALVPSSPIAYEALPLFVIPKNRIEMITLAITTNVVVALVGSMSLQGERLRYLAVAQPAMVWLVYVPALAMVLRRPNVGSAPDWLERASGKLPAWLRGNSLAAPSRPLSSE